MDTASVDINVAPNDSPPSDCDFGIPLSTPLQSINTDYENVYVLGTGGPNLVHLSKFTVNWDLINNGLYQFSFNLNLAPWYINFSNSNQNFNAPRPAITLVNTGIPGLDGTYSVGLYEGDFVMKADTYTLYFSNARAAPNCNIITNRTGIRATVEKSNNMNLDVVLYPNPTIDFVTVSIPPSSKAMREKQLIVTNLAGQRLALENIGGGKMFTTVDLRKYPSGMYIISVYENARLINRH